MKSFTVLSQQHVKVLTFRSKLKHINCQKIKMHEITIMKCYFALDSREIYFEIRKKISYSKTDSFAIINGLYNIFPWINIIFP